MMTNEDLRNILVERVGAASPSTTKGYIQVAKELGFTPNYIAHVILGYRQVSPALARAMGFDVAPRCFVPIGVPATDPATVTQ